MFRVRTHMLFVSVVCCFMLSGPATRAFADEAAAASTATQVEPGRPAVAQTPVGPSAVWNPDVATMRAIREKCSSLGPPELKACFIAGMRDSGASPEAIRFTSSIEGIVILRGFRKVGPVDIAYIVYPFRANENDGCLLVNGAPRILDIDALQDLPQQEMKKDPTYRDIAAKFPEAMLFAGDRTGEDYPLIEELSGGGKRFIASYRLKNKCRACELIGMVRFGFDFDAAGTFLGARFIAVSKEGSGLL